MPKSKNLAAYPTQYYQTFRAMLGHDKVVIPCGTVKAAKAYQFDLCAFRQALSHNEHPLADDAFSFFIKVEGTDLVFENKNNSEVLLATRKVLEEMGIDVEAELARDLDPLENKIRPPAKKAEEEELELNVPSFEPKPDQVIEKDDSVF